MDENSSFTNATFTIPESYRGSHTVKVMNASSSYDIAGFITKQSLPITRSLRGYYLHTSA